MAIKTQNRRILDKARALFWKKGYMSTSMRDIAAAYGCKPANIYNFFPNKEDILFEVLREEMEQIIDPIRHLGEDDGTSPEDQLRLIIVSHLKLTLSYRRSAKLLFDVSLDNLSRPKRKKIVDLRDAYDQIIRQVIRRGIDSGSFREIDEKLAGFMIASMITRTRLWYHPKKGVSAEELAGFIFELAVNGLRLKK
ncbi:MAG: TetR/AcrR family transcriptional regulator [Desulfobacterales bacterium]|nr:TetR/AcrR family transcriptional regulator [Desulfobacterales bacterium]MBL7102418.1 TetR family transcriptional regulator [Desulfobacteraceae bacterium]MBL7171708.1 TetR family transcriptional regulator [Desulfobacteraceae bacterium]